MPRPEQLSTSELLASIAKSAEPVKPSALSAEFGVSRATVHRKIEQLLADSLVIRTGSGPAAAYRVPNAKEVLEQSLLKQATFGQVRLAMGNQAAYALQEGLELFSRVGIGQLEALLEPMRQRLFGSQGAGPDEQGLLEDANALVIALKSHLLGFSANASFGIYNPHVHAKVLRAWALQKAVRHRTAWDLSPTGFRGVHHDEPLDASTIAGLYVHSDSPDAARKPQRYVLEMPLDVLELLEEALRWSLRLRTGDAHAVLDMAKESLLVHSSGVPVTQEVLEGAATYATHLTPLLGQPNVEGHNVRLDKLEGHLLQLLKASQGFLENRTETRIAAGDEPAVVVSWVGDSPWALDVDELPAGMLLNFAAGRYRVIAPSKRDDVLVVVASSASLQTAIQKAKSYAAKTPADVSF